MDSEPGGSPEPASVSLWQTNCAAIRLDRFINWLRIGAISVVDGANYLSEGGSPA
jgi:hypothetical protein